MLLTHDCWLMHTVSGNHQWICFLDVASWCVLPIFLFSWAKPASSQEDSQKQPISHFYLHTLERRSRLKQLWRSNVFCSLLLSLGTYQYSAASSHIMRLFSLHPGYSRTPTPPHTTSTVPVQGPAESLYLQQPIFALLLAWLLNTIDRVCLTVE